MNDKNLIFAMIVECNIYMFGRPIMIECIVHRRSWSTWIRPAHNYLLSSTLTFKAKVDYYFVAIWERLSAINIWNAR